ncbi:hypothetical protein [Comamonas sp. UBA7528]|uniref:hypothetical protein n=1 Tax=Comamonas sp. UBA7528 TaxID=1946391 RepID=UPI0025BAE4B9|nr:hypothetical protein [Comamonas sp. UBA7528]
MSPWLSNPVVHTSIGDMAVELQMPAGGRPSSAMLELVSKLVEYAKQNAEHILDLIYAHYRYAEANEWLDFWDVPGGLARAEVMNEVESVALVVDDELVASVYVNPHWDPEHKLDLLFEGTITAVNGEAFDLVDGTLILR